MLITTETHYRTQPVGTQIARQDGKPGVYVKTARGTYRDTHTGREYTPKQMAIAPRERIDRNNG